MKKDQLISVFTVNWNGKKWLERYLKSIECQTYKNIENIVVDNASTDGSLSYIKQNFPKVRIIRNKKNYGLAKATNIGFAKSKGKLVLFMNNDTWVDKHFIERMVKFYSNHNYIAVSAAEKRYFDNRTFFCNTTIDPTGSPAYYIPTYSFPNKIFYLTVCFLCKKEDFISTGGMDSDFFMYYEDVDWFWRLSLLGKKFYVIKNLFIHHAGAGSTGSGLKYNFFLWRNQNALQTLLKNYSLMSLMIVLPFYLLQNFLEILFFLFLLKPKIAWTYIEGWVFNLVNIKTTLVKRQWVQNKRIVSDLVILKKMYFGFGKYLLIKSFFHLNTI